MSNIGRRHRLWILEDDPGPQFIYEEILGGLYDIRFFSSLREFEEQMASPLAEGAPDLLIADLRLPDGSFLSILNDPRRAARISCPFLVVSSSDEIESLRGCFDRGAKDYITKPFRKAELQVKVERILTDLGSEFEIDPVALSISSRTGATSVLTSKEFQIVSMFKRMPGSLLTKEDLLREIWGGIGVSAGALDVHLFNLRRKLIPIGLAVEALGSGRYRLGPEARP